MSSPFISGYFPSTLSGQITLGLYSSLYKTSFQVGLSVWEKRDFLSFISNLYLLGNLAGLENFNATF